MDFAYSRLVGALTSDRPTRISEVTDGTSNTILYAEIAGRPVSYSRSKKLPGDAIFGGWADPGSPLILGGGEFDINASNNTTLYSFHSRGAAAVNVDGSVHFLSKEISLQTLISLTTRSGGETISEEF
ncbi:MAG: DUF1559 domain-containing protein [Gemmataceae bacterium]